MPHVCPGQRGNRRLSRHGRHTSYGSQPSDSSLTGLSEAIKAQYATIRRWAGACGAAFAQLSGMVTTTLNGGLIIRRPRLAFGSRGISGGT